MVIGISTLPSMILIVATWMVNSAEPIASVMELSAELIASVKRLSVSAALRTSSLAHDVSGVDERCLLRRKIDRFESER